MAKPKFPKKNNVKESVSPSIPAAIPEHNVVAAEPASAALSSAEAVRTETRKSEPKKTARKPEIVRTDSRATVIPINLEEEVRRLAYLFSERRGFEAGHETEDWLNAEREVLQRYHQHSA
jgi:hypothetical protein